MAQPTLFTVGHSTRTLDELVALLQGAGVTLVVDVRRFPGSRRHPQFGRERLADGLAAAGIGYRHAPELGGRRQALADSPNTAWRNDQLRGYADHMGSAEFAAGLAALLAAAEAEPTTVLCAEADPGHCHRQLLADAVASAGWQVVHLLAGGGREAHRTHSRLRVDERGRLRYPAAGGSGRAGDRAGSEGGSGPSSRQRSLPGFGSRPAG